MFDPTDEQRIDINLEILEAWNGLDKHLPEGKVAPFMEVEINFSCGTIGATLIGLREVHFYPKDEDEMTEEQFWLCCDDLLMALNDSFLVSPDEEFRVDEDDFDDNLPLF